MCNLNAGELSVLRELYAERSEQLAALGQALRSLLELTEAFRRRVGRAMPPWDLWEVIVRQVEQPGEAVTSR